MKVKTHKGTSVNLLTSKSRGASLNYITLPRLELLGALIAACLTSKGMKMVNLNRPFVEYYWIDSKISFSFWIKGKWTR